MKPSTNAPRFCRTALVATFGRFCLGRAETKSTRPEFAQPALFVTEYALACLWRQWGVVPKAMLGHSIGEYVAAHLAGVMGLEDALSIVATRGRLMQACRLGGDGRGPSFADRTFRQCCPRASRSRR